VSKSGAAKRPVLSLEVGIGVAEQHEQRRWLMQRALRMILYFVATIIFAVTVAACGGGGGNNFSNIPNGGGNGAGTISGNAK
jgi:hypothetical protein